MLKIENTEVFGWEAAIRGCRNALNSWPKSDSWFYDENIEGDIYGHTITTDLDGFPTQQDTDLTELPEEMQSKYYQYPPCIIGPNDLDLMKRLAKAGSTDAKYRRMINVTADVTAPLYWWKEYDTYKVATVANSCSTMHKIHAKEFTLDDFSCDHLLDWPDIEMPEAFDVDHPYEIGDTPVILRRTTTADLPANYLYYSPIGCLQLSIEMLNRCRNLFLKTKDKQYWYQMIQLLPSSYNQRRTIQLNYEVLTAIYPKRKDHKLDCWHTFCDWIRSLPYSELITGEYNG